MKVASEDSRKRKRQKIKRRRPRVGHRWLFWILFFRYLRACIFLVNARTIAMSSLACMMVYLCQSEVLNMRFRMEFSILSVGTVFPLVFSIQQAFSRREEALRNLSILKGLVMGTYLCNRDWDVADGVTVRANLGNDQAPQAVRCAQLLRELLVTLRRWLGGRTPYESEAEWRMLYGTTGPRVADFTSILIQLSGAFLYGKEGRRGDFWGADSSSDDDDDDDDGDGDGEGGGSRKGRPPRRGADDKDGNGNSDQAEAMAEADPHWQLYFKMYDVLSRINVHNEKLMVVGNVTKAGEAGMSRLAAYVSRMAETIERLRYLREYRTPFMLRHVSFVLVMGSIVLASPYFAFMCVNSRWEDDTSGTCPAGYFTAVLYVLVLSTLFHVQLALENPFDGVGVDDVFVNLDREFNVTVHRYIRDRAEEAAKGAAEVAAKGAAAAAEKAAGDEKAAGGGGGPGGGAGGDVAGVKSGARLSPTTTPVEAFG